MLGGLSSMLRHLYVGSQPPLHYHCITIAYGHRLNSAIETNKLGAPVVFDFKAGCPAAER